MASILCKECGLKESVAMGYCSGCLDSPEQADKEKALHEAILESEALKKKEWEELLAKGQKAMSDSEKLIFAQLQIITELLGEIADGINRSNKIASAPRYGFGVGTFFGDE